MAGKKKSATKAAVDALNTGDPVKASDIKTTRSDETPEAQPTKAAKTKAAEDQFAKADKAGEPKRDADEVAAEELRVGIAARGY